MSPAAPNSRGRVAPYQDLLTALRQGDDIPSFCYVEPYWGWGVGLPDGSDYVGFQGNDYHPPTWVGPAEWDLNELYVALTNSRQWERMLVIITFDEHGGTFDHVAPARAVNPDGKIGPSGFRFERMGVRVPTILVSPFVTPRTVFRAPNGSSAVFDHTSIISTVLGWAGTDPSFITAMGKRAAAAPRFDGVLAPTRVQGTAPRFVVTAHYQHQGGPKGAHNLGFDADGLTVHHHRAALACAADPDGYVAALRNISRT